MDTDLFKHRWRAYYKNGLHNQSIVYGRDAAEAEKTALAEYRKSTTMMSMWPASKVVDHLELLDPETAVEEDDDQARG